MGTNGLYGFRKNGIDKLAYQHFDSYPAYLGKRFYNLCKDLGSDNLSKLYDLVVVVDKDSIPTASQVSICLNCGYTSLSVLDGWPTNWYLLLYNLRKDFSLYKKALRYTDEVFMPESKDFIKNSLYCDYAYIANLDTGKFEVYKGFDNKPQKGNRYGMTPNEEGYYPCQLWKTFSIDSKKRTKWFDNHMHH